MTETTRTTECSAAGSTLYLAFELGSTKWTLAFTISRAQRPRIRTIAAGELGAVAKEIAQARERLGVSPTVGSAAAMKQIGALLGLAPVPYRSDQRVQDQGISKAGRRHLRRVGIQLAWCWLRYQPDSALTTWFQQRFGAAGGRSRRIGIVAVARQLMIALWRFAAHGVIPEGATLKTA